MNPNPLKPLRVEDMIEFEPLTANQALAIKEFKSGNHLILNGSAGTGKTFLAIALALEEVLDKSTPYDKVVVVRSIVPTRDIGFLPGDEEEKKKVYEAPYIGITADLFGHSESWERLKKHNAVEFMSTSFVRGITITDAIVVLDESQNCTFHELSSISTRLGRNTRLIVSGDYHQSDLVKASDKQGINQYLIVMTEMKRASVVTFTWKDIVRDDFVRDYVMTCEMKNFSMS